MAFNFPFWGANKRYISQDQPEDGLGPRFPDMIAHNNDVMSFSVWRPSTAELREIVKTGEIWIAVNTGTGPMNQTFVGSLSFIKQACADLGKLWPRKPKEIIDEPSHQG